MVTFTIAVTYSQRVKSYRFFSGIRRGSDDPDDFPQSSGSSFVVSLCDDPQSSVGSYSAGYSGDSVGCRDLAIVPLPFPARLTRRALCKPIDRILCYQPDYNAYRHERPSSERGGAKPGGPSGISSIHLVPLDIRDSIVKIGQTDPTNVQQIAASQLALLAGYHQIALAQSRRSFLWALIGSGIGLVFFFAAVAVALLQGLTLASIVPLISGAVVEVVSGVVFYLYGKTTSQLSSFHSRLELLQRYLLANSLCEGLDGEERSKARAALIREIYNPSQAATAQNS
jgi:hypothetical protein